MKQESTVLGLNPQKLAELLNIGSDLDQDLGTEHKKEELLHDWMAASLPLDKALAQSLPEIVSRLCRDLQPISGDAFGKILLDPKSDIDAIEKIRHYSKKIAEAAKSDPEHDAATTIYYAAIANAMVFHEKRITKFSYESLEKSFAALTAHQWLTPDLSELFSKAVVVCRNKDGGNCQDNSV